MTLIPDSPIAFEEMLCSGSNSQLSTNIDPLYALSVVMYYLANDLSSDISELIYWSIHHIPWHLLEALLRLDSPIVRESWKKLLDWAFIFGDESFFESLMSVLIEDWEWLKWHGACCLITAAWYDCHETCRLLIRRGISPNWTCTFPSGAYWFPGFKERRTAARYHPDNYILSSLSLPLIEAAARGNAKSVRVLLDGGADVNLRCEGYTAAGYLLGAINKENLNKERYLDTMELLLENGADVNEPFQENDSSYGLGLHPSDKPYCSDETLLDEAYLTGDTKLADLLQKFDATPQSLLTVSGIISNVEKGIQELQTYIHIASFPRGLRRRRIQQVSLRRWFKKPKSEFSTMLQVDFNLRLASLECIKPVNPGRAFSSNYQDAAFIGDFVIKILEHTPLPLLSNDTVSFLLQEEPAIKVRLIRACLVTSCRNDFQRLLDSGLNVTEQEGVLMMAAAARWDNFPAVSLLQSYGVDINGTLRVKKDDCSVLLLAATGIEIGHELSLILPTRTVASIEMLEFLVRQGADINTCHPALQPSINWDQHNNWALTWFIDNGLDLDGESICSLMMRRLKCSGSLKMLQSLIHRDVPIFALDEPLEDHRKFTSNEHPLSFFISLQPDVEFIYQLLETRIDVNGTGQNVQTDTPLQAASRIKDLGLVKNLISRGALINNTEYEGEFTPLQLACRSGKYSVSCPVYFDIAKYLLENGADPNVTGGRRGGTPLGLAILSSDPDIRLIELLLGHGADVNAWTQTKAYRQEMCFILPAALTIARHLGVHKRRIVEMLIDRGANINARWERKYGGDISVLEATCNHGGPDCIDFVKLLLDRGANPDIDFHYDFTGNIDVVKLLLDRGMNPNPRNSNSYGPLAMAAGSGDLAMAVLLLAAGARVPVGEHSSNSPLSNRPLVCAARKGRLDMVALLVGFETRKEAVEEAILSARQNGYLALASFIQQYVDRGNSRTK